MIEITKLQLKSLSKLLEDQNLGFTYTDAAVKEIVHEGFDPIYGARPLRRAIQKLVENPISTLIIEKKVKSGDQIVVDFDGENFLFNIEKTEFVTEDQLQSKNTVKNFFCETCGNHFDTLVVKNSTVVCSKCASAKVQEVAEDKEIKLHGEEKVQKKAPSSAIPPQLNGFVKPQESNYQAG